MLLAIVNSDQRMQEVYVYLSSMYETILINEFTSFTDFSLVDALILPVKGISATGSIVSNGKELVLSESFWKAFYHKPVFVGIPQTFLDHHPFQQYHYMFDETLKMENARYTAEGILFLLIDNTSRSILDQSVDVIGYGVCGKEIVRWLEALQIQVRIIRRENVDDDPRVVSVKEYEKIQCGDVIINTSISPVITREMMASWTHKPFVIDIATPDVIDYTAAKQMGVRIIKAGALPTMVAYKSAGIAIGNYVRGILHDKR